MSFQQETEYVKKGDQDFVEAQNQVLKRRSEAGWMLVTAFPHVNVSGRISGVSLYFRLEGDVDKESGRN